MDQEEQEILSKAKRQNFSLKFCSKLIPKFVCNIHKIILGFNDITCKNKENCARLYIVTELIKNVI